MSLVGGAVSVPREIVVAVAVAVVVVVIESNVNLELDLAYLLGLLLGLARLLLLKDDLSLLHSYTAPLLDAIRYATGEGLTA